MKSVGSREKPRGNQIFGSFGNSLYTRAHQRVLREGRFAGSEGRFAGSRLICRLPTSDVEIA